MSTIIYRVSGDAGAPPVSVTLLSDAAPIDLAVPAAQVKCHLRNVVSDAVTVIGPLTGTALGVVVTPLIPSHLVEGRYSMEWEVAGGATYPGRKEDRPELRVRAQAVTV